MNAPDDIVAANVRRASILAQTGDAHKALGLLLETARNHPPTADLQCCLGETHYRLGDARRAVAAWEAALELDPSHVKSQRWLETVRPTIAEPPRRQRGAKRRPLVSYSAPTVGDPSAAAPRLTGQLPSAPLGVRLRAFACDTLIVAMLSLLLAVPIAAWSFHHEINSLSDLLTSRWPLLALVFALPIAPAYAWFWVRRYGNTPGKALAGITIVAAFDEPPDPWCAAVRALGILLNLATAGLGYALLLFDPLQRGLHDRLAGTRVVVAETEHSSWYEMAKATPLVLAAVCVIALGVLMPNILNARRRQALTQTFTDLGAISSALERFRRDQRRYPAALYQLTTPIAYINPLPTDPFGRGMDHHYQYAVHPSQGYWVLIARGPDRVFALDAATLTAQAVRAIDLASLTQGKLYDPNFGLISSGDIVQWGEPMLR